MNQCCALILVIAAFTKFLPSGDEASSIRELEARLAHAIRTKDKAVLINLTARDFRVAVRKGSAWDNVSGEEDRKGWMDSLLDARIVSYEVVLSHVSVARTQAFVDLRETWIIRGSRDIEAERRFSTRDVWLKIDGAWRLASRYSQLIN